MRVFATLVLGLFIFIGCAKVQVEAPKEPIKVDIAMRLDIYQHVEKDIDDIENIVSGAAPAPTTKGNQSFLSLGVTDAFAEALSSDVEQAALRRRDRRAELVSLESKGIVGENKLGLVEIRNASAADSLAKALVSAENSDRMVIYQGVAQKNGTTLAEVQKLYAGRLQQDAPSGTPVEAGGGWTVK